jgi:hypothetical protein
MYGVITTVRAPVEMYDGRHAVRLLNSRRERPDVLVEQALEVLARPSD